MAATDDLVQRVAAQIEAGIILFDESPLPDCDLTADELAQIARAAITETLAEVDRHLSAVQYDPAPYSAMKARLAAIRAGTKPTPSD